MVLGAMCPAESCGQVRRRIRSSVAARDVVDARQRGEHTGPALSWWQVLELVAAGDEYAEPVAAASGHHGEGGQCRQHDLALLPPGRPEVEARRAGDHDERVQLAVCLRGADVRFEGARGEAPVDAAGVVARLVTTGAGPFGAG